MLQDKSCSSRAATIAAASVSVRRFDNHQFHRIKHVVPEQQRLLQQVFQFSCIFYEIDYSLLFINLWRSCVVDPFAGEDVKINDEILGLMENMFVMHHMPIRETNLPRLILFEIVRSLFFLLICCWFCCP